MGMGEAKRSGIALLALSLPLAAAGVALSAPAPSQAPAPAERDATFFEAKVRPLLAKRCFACHSQKIAQGGLRLDDGAALRRGGDSGPVVNSGKPEESRLLEAVRYTNPHLQMPPSGKLPDAEVEILTTWVTQGAAWPAPANAQAPGSPVKPKGPHWAFQPLKRVPPPAVKDARWPSRRIDQYVLARLENAGLRPSPRADRRTLVRRVYFDLIGLPPSPAEVEAFVNDPSPDAYAKLVDRLLASPAYGERWGRHWLDLVRYCDIPESWAQTDAQPWLYRDWVVKALNEDLPYDQFVRRQLAADQLDVPPTELAALGFLGLSPSYWKELKLAPDVIKTVVAEEWEERITAVSGTFLGLTVGCARCHDHKFDPISQKDYYALAGVFASTRLTSRPLLPAAEAERVVKARADVTALEAEAKRLSDLAAKDAARAPELRTQAEAAMQRAAELKRNTPGYDAPTAYSVQDAYLDVLPDGPAHTQLAYRDGEGRDVPMQLRGNPAKPGQVVPRGFVAVLSGGKPVRFTHGSGRSELADAIVREGAPLSARVIVNRVWKHHFGSGIVETPSNFGIQGDRPTHPELLDDLAARFIENGWSLKWLHREIVLSSTYQQNSAVRQPAAAKAVAVDPDNRLLWRMNRRRLEVEPWRDAILSASGVLDTHLGGPAQELSDPKNVRRTLYGVVKRRELDDLLRLYDFPDPTAHSPARFHTTTPLQQLYVLNSDFIRRQAEALAARVRKEAPEGTDAQIELAHRLLYGRAPSEKELTAGRTFLGASGEAAWRQYCEVLLARNELMFVE